jgi:PAS domain S-box-containing protein
MARRKLTPEEKLLYELETLRKQMSPGTEAPTVVQQEDEQVTFLLESDVEAIDDTGARAAPVEPGQAAGDRYRALVEAIPDGFALLEPVAGAGGAAADLRILEVNRAFQTMSGLGQDQLVGRTILEVLPDTEPSWIAACGRVAATGAAVRIESRSRTLNMPLEVVAFSPGGGRVACTFQDVTDRAGAGGAARTLAEVREVVADLLGRLEAERADFAATLQDRLRQGLAVLGMKLGMTQACADQGETGKIAGIVDLAIDQIGEMGQTVTELLRRVRPRKLAEEGLFGALAWHAERISKVTSLLVLVEGAPPSPRLPPERELALFRIVEEALDGVVRPACATRALITLEPRAGGLTMAISHNGASPVDSRGVVAVRERALALGAAFRAEPMPGGGTRLVIVVPT